MTGGETAADASETEALQGHAASETGLASVTAELNPIGGRVQKSDSAPFEVPQRDTRARHQRANELLVCGDEESRDEAVLQLDCCRSPCTTREDKGDSSECNRDSVCTNIDCPDYMVTNYGLRKDHKATIDERAARADDFFLRAEVVHLMSDGIKRAVSFDPT